LKYSSLQLLSKGKEHHSVDLIRERLAPEWQSLDVAARAPQSLVSQMGVVMGMSSFIHWSCNSQWIGEQYKMGKTTQTGWSMRDITRGRAHHHSLDPTPLGPAGTPLVPALTHSTSGTVTGSNVRLGTSKDLSAGHETRLQHFGGDDNTHQGATGKCSDCHCYTFLCLRHHHLVQGS